MSCNIMYLLSFDSLNSRLFQGTPLTVSRILTRAKDPKILIIGTTFLYFAGLWLIKRAIFTRVIHVYWRYLKSAYINRMFKFLSLFGLSWRCLPARPAGGVKINDDSDECSFARNNGACIPHNSSTPTF